MDLSFLEPLKKHPWWTGIAIIGGGLGLYLYWRSGSSSSSSDAALNGVTAYGGPDDATIQAEAGLQAANLSANLQGQSIAAQQEVTDSQTAGQVQIAEDQINAAASEINAQVNSANAATGAQVQVAQLQAQSSVQLQQLSDQASVDIDQSNNGTALSIAQLQYGAANLATADNYQSTLATLGAAEQISANNNGASVSEALIASQTSEFGYQAEENITGMNDSTAAAINYQNVTGAETINQQNVSGAENIAGIESTTQLGLGADAVQENEANDTAAVTINGQNTTAETSVLNNYITTTGQVATTELNDETQIGLGQQGLQNEALQLVGNGTFNKGGAGGSNQVSALGALFGEPTVAQAGQSAAAATNVSSSASAILAAINPGSALKGLFGSGGVSTVTNP